MELANMKRNSLKIVQRGRITGEMNKDIIQAAIAGDSRLVKSLLEDGVDINTVSENGFSCLHIACFNGDANVFDVLLGHHSHHGDLNLSLETFDPPRTAWQIAMASHHYALADRIDQLVFGENDGPPSAPKLVR
jgi:hypothetical protein